MSKPTYVDRVCADCGVSMKVRKDRAARHRGSCKTCNIKKVAHLGTLARVERNRKRPYEWVYLHLLRAARSRGHDVEFSYEEFLSLVTQPFCAYCGHLVEWVRFGRSRDRTPTRYNLDRMDSSKGYTLDNVVVCCTLCNKTKSDLYSFGEFIPIGKAIRGVRASRGEYVTTMPIQGPAWADDDPVDPEFLSNVVDDFAARILKERTS